MRPTTTYVVHAFLQPVPCNCHANSCNAFNGSCVCAWSGTFQLQCPLSWKYALPRQGRCATRIRLGLCVQRNARWPKLQRAKVSPLSSAFFVLGESADLDSKWTCKSLKPSPFMIWLRHHLSRTTGVLDQRQHRGTVESRLEIRPSVLTLIEVFRKRHSEKFPLAQDTAAPFSHNIFQ